MIEILIKRCRKCRAEKTLDCFAKFKHGKNGLNSQCKECCNERNRLFKSNPEVKARYAKYNQKYLANPEVRKERQDYNNNPEVKKRKKERRLALIEKRITEGASTSRTASGSRRRRAVPFRTADWLFF